MKKKISFYLAIIVSLVILSCRNNVQQKENLLTPVENSNSSPESQTNNEPQIPVGEQPNVADSANATQGSLKNTPGKAIANIDWDKKIIKTASLKLEVNDFKKYNQFVYATVKQFGGYIAQEDQNINEERNETNITIKVPVYQFENLMNELPVSDAKVIERKINTDDVSAKIIDTKSRLETRKEMRQKYLEFLRASKDMKDVLAVQNEVNNIQEEIESAEGQVNFLSHQSALSTINLGFFQLQSGYKPEVVEKPSFLNRTSAAFKSGAAWIADVFIGLMSIWPFILLIITAIFIWRKAQLHKITTAKAPAKK